MTLNMQTGQLTLRGGVRAAIVGATASLVVLSTMLPSAALADQAPIHQTTAASQQPEAIGSHTHQLHGVVKTAPSSGSTAFVVTTDRYGDVTVSLAGTASNAHAHGHGRGPGAAGAVEVATTAG